MNEPELITILEGPTPDFKPAPELWNLSVYEGPRPVDVAFCRLRTGNGQDIRDRCTDAWETGRPVQLDFPDELRLRQQLNVVAMRLAEAHEGTELHLWLRQPVEFVAVDEDDEEELFDDEDDDIDAFGF